MRPSPSSRDILPPLSHAASAMLAGRCEEQLARYPRASHAFIQPATSGMALKAGTPAARCGCGARSASPCVSRSSRAMVKTAASAQPGRGPAECSPSHTDTQAGGRTNREEGGVCGGPLRVVPFEGAIPACAAAAAVLHSGRISPAQQSGPCIAPFLLSGCGRIAVPVSDRIAAILLDLHAAAVLIYTGVNVDATLNQGARQQPGAVMCTFL